MKATDFTLQTLRGAPLPLAQYAGRPLLIANTASKCGFTGQYAGLQQLWTEYEARGLVVLAIPSNDFGNQEPGDADTVAATCELRFGATFPVAAKSPVKGARAIPLFQWLAAQAGPLGHPRWNFFKYLVGRDGQLVTWFSSVTKPESAKVRLAIERSLGNP